MLDFLRFDPAGCAFPRPFAPVLPALQFAGLSLSGSEAAVLDGPGTHHFARGRYALAHAYRLAGVGAGGALLAPAYHCRTMLDPALALGAPVQFYPLKADLTPDLPALEALLDQTTRGAPVKALLLTHYFGIEQDAVLVRDLAALCRARGIALVEDCSHAWQVAAKRANAGVAGPQHMIVASPYKFFACEDGGMLWSGAASPAPATRSPGLLRELKALRDAMARRSAAAALATPALASQADPVAIRRGADHRESQATPSPMYQAAHAQDRSLALSRFVMRHSRTDAIVAARRRHYAQWTEALQGVAGARVLFPQLAADCAPYMLALLIERPDPCFYQLKLAGMPIWRWDDMALATDPACAIAQHYRLHLLHLPCHQGLSAQQMAAMTALVAKVLA